MSTRRPLHDHNRSLTRAIGPSDPKGHHRHAKALQHETRQTDLMIESASLQCPDTPTPGSSSLPAWLDGLSGADAVGPMGTDDEESIQAGERDDMSWELRTETVNEGRDYLDVSVLVYVHCVS